MQRFIAASCLTLAAFGVGLWLGDGRAAPTGHDPLPLGASPGSGGSPGPSLAELEEWAATARRIEGRLEAIETRLAAGDLPRTPIESGAGTSVEELHSELVVLRGMLARLLEVRKSSSERLETLRAERPSADWTALDPLLARAEVDLEAARRDVVLMSRAQVLERFGRPDLTFPNDPGVIWVYGRGWRPERGAYDLQLVFVFRDGVVVEFRLERL